MEWDFWDKMFAVFWEEQVTRGRECLDKIVADTNLYQTHLCPLVEKRRSSYPRAACVPGLR